MCPSRSETVADSHFRRSRARAPNTRSEMKKTSLPLEGIKVLDLTHARAGPTAVRQLADWGADVIKVEPPAELGRNTLGDARHGFDFQNLHRNKRSLALNLKTEEGKAIFLKLAAKADVIVEN